MNYPEHEKLHLVYPQSQAAGDFFTWLIDTKGLALCEQEPEQTGDHAWLWKCIRNWKPTTQRIEALLCEYFDIDILALEKEKQAMLKRAQRLSP